MPTEQKPDLVAVVMAAECRADVASSSTAELYRPTTLVMTFPLMS